MYVQTDFPKQYSARVQPHPDVSVKYHIRKANKPISKHSVQVWWCSFRGLEMLHPRVGMLGLAYLHICIGFSEYSNPQTVPLNFLQKIPSCGHGISLDGATYFLMMNSFSPRILDFWLFSKTFFPYLNHTLFLLAQQKIFNTCNCFWSFWKVPGFWT